MFKGPDFLCVGAQKAGTTWLYHHLKAHPQIWMPPIKELHYFDQRYIPETRSWAGDARRGKIEQAIKQIERLSDSKNFEAKLKVAKIIQNFTETDEWYSSIFQCAPLGTVSGEITPEYSLLKKPQIIDLKKKFGLKKVMMVLRCPLDRAISEVRMLLRVGLVETYEEALHPSWNVVEKSSYHVIHDSWNTALNSDCLQLISYDRLATQPLYFLEDVCEFLEVDFHPNYFRDIDRVVFPGNSESIPERVRTALKERISGKAFDLYQSAN